MRWIKHPSSFCRSAAMTDVRETLGPAGYGAVWLLLERIAETWSGKTEPELCVSAREWARTCGLSAKKLQDLLGILENHGIIFSKDEGSKLRLTAPILLELQDEWTGRTRKNSASTPEPPVSNSGIQQSIPEKEKNKDRHGLPPPTRSALFPVLSRHGIKPDSERGRRIVLHIEAMKPNNPGGYLEHILKQKPHFDPEEHSGRQHSTASVGEVLQHMGYTNMPRQT